MRRPTLTKWIAVLAVLREQRELAGELVRCRCGHEWRERPGWVATWCERCGCTIERES